MIEPLVLLPGLMCDARLFRPQLDTFSRRRAVVVSALSRGERIEEIASDLLDQLPHRFALAGHSLGGVVALELVRRAPDRVSRLCLISTDAQADTPRIAAAREDLIIGAQAGRLEEVLRKLVGSDALAPGPQRIPVLNNLMAMAMDLGPEVFVTQMRALQRRADQQGTLRRIKGPSLVLCGVHDTLTPVRKHAFMAEMIPNTTFHSVEDAGHLPTLEAPDDVTRAMQVWLDEPLRLDYG